MVRCTISRTVMGMTRSSVTPRSLVYIQSGALTRTWTMRRAVDSGLVITSPLGLPLVHQVSKQSFRFLKPTFVKLNPKVSVRFSQNYNNLVKNTLNLAKKGSNYTNICPQRNGFYTRLNKKSVEKLGRHQSQQTPGIASSPSQKS